MSVRLQVLAALPRLLVPDVARSVAWYRDVLGFTVCDVIGDPPELAILDVAPGQGLHLARAVDGKARPQRGEDGKGIDMYLRLAASDAERFVAHARAHAPDRVGPTHDRPWKMRETFFVDEEGFAMCVAGDLTGERRAGTAQLSPELLVADVGRAASFYRDALGFTIINLIDNPPGYALVERDGALLHLALADDPARVRSTHAIDGGHDVYLELHGVDALAEELRVRGVELVRGPETMEWEQRELDVRDADGHLLRFAEDQCFDPDDPSSERIGVLRDAPWRGVS